MSILIEILFTALEASSVYAFFFTFLVPKKRTSLSKVIICLLIIGSGSILSSLLQHNLANLFISVVTALLTSFILFNSSITKKLLIATLYIIFSMLTELTVMLIVSGFYKFTSIFNQSSNMKFFILIFVAFLKLIFIIWLKLARSKKDAMGGNKFYILQSVIPILSIVFIATYLNIETNITNLTSFYILISMLVSINIVQYIIYTKVEDMYVDRYENTMLEQRNEHLSEYMRIVENNIERIKMMKHDMKNSLLLLQGTMKEDMNKAIVEIDKMVVDTDYAEVHFFTPNSGINALLNIKYNKAINAGIDIHYDIVLIEKFKAIEDRDVASIFGNLLDNAIESCYKVDGDKYIEFNAYFRKNCLVIKMKNSTDGKTKNLKTSKKDKEWHGLGMRIIDKLITKYGGNYDWYFRKKYFNIEILLWDNKL